MDICVGTAVENTVRVTIGAILCLADMLGIPNGIIATLNQVRKKISNFAQCPRTDLSKRFLPKHNTTTE